MTLHNVNLSRYTRHELGQYAQKHGEPMHFLVYRFLLQYLTASQYAHHYDRESECYTDEFTLPKLTKTPYTRIQCNIPSGDWAELVMESKRRNIPFDEFIDRIIYMVVMDFSKLDKNIEEYHNDKNNQQ